MPSIQISQSSYTIASVAGGCNLTITANTGSDAYDLYPGMVGNLIGPLGVPASVRVVIDSIVTVGSVIKVRLMPFSNTNGISVAADFTTYALGAIYFEAQTAVVDSLYLERNEERWPVVVFDAAFDAASITVNGLSSAKSYTVWVSTNAMAAAGDGPVVIQPNGSSAGCAARMQNGNSVQESINYLQGGYALVNYAYSSVAKLYARRNGKSAYFARTGGDNVYGGIGPWCHGWTTTDFTSLTVGLPNVRTGWLTIVEETP